MRIFETRHGQVAPKDFYKNDPSLPVGDTALSEQGKEQAFLLAKRLKELNFNGVIFSSPYDRTMKTACIVAEELGLSVTPLACLHEIVSVSKITENFRGATAEELKKNYSATIGDFELPERWWGDRVEEISDVIERLKNGLKPVLSNLPQEIDVLLVGHGATSVALRHLFGVVENRSFHWNCHLSLLYSSSGENYANDCEHLPMEKWTGNAILRSEQERKFQEELTEIRSRFVENANVVLHIGDTETAAYPYYNRLFEEFKPSVIIHTGDVADELKAGRRESVRPYWKNSAKVMLRKMEQTGARVIVVAGNNDLEDELKGFATTAEILPRNAIVELYGKKVLLCHEVNRMDENVDVDAFLYGHGLTGETRTPEDNEKKGKTYFNATWGASLHDFERKTSVILRKAYL